MRVIGVVGLPGSGKSEAAAVAEDLGIPVVTMGDVIRQECRERGLDPATHHGEVAQALRAEEGEAAIAERSLPVIRERLAESDADTVLVDGIRSDVEVEEFRSAFGEEFTLVEVYAPFDVREERLVERGRDTSAADGGESLAERDRRERGFGMGDAIEQADVRLENTDTLEEFHETVRDLLASGADVAGSDEASGGEDA